MNNKMKKIITLITLLVFTTNYATDRFVDPMLSSGNGTTIFTTITAAINAAVNGDRIIVTSGTYNEAALTIGKSLQIMPQTPGTTINFNANITIAGFSGMKFEITGFNLAVYSINSSPITSGNYLNRAKISIIDCRVTSIDINNEYYECNIIKNNISQSLSFRYGNIILNSVNNISFLDESQDNPSGTNQKTLITNNYISDYIFIYNNDSKLIVANNTIINGLYLKRWYSNSSYNNKIMNNQFATNSHTKLLVSTINVPVYNLIFTNNVGNLSFYCGGDNGTPPFSNTNLNYNTMNTIYLDLDWYYTATSNSGLTTSLFPSNDVNGVFEWSYNGIQLPRPAPTGIQPLSFINLAGGGIVDSGNPNHDYYDIDLTVNDRGLNGGPFSQLNYNAANPNNSKAFIFDLDMPTDLFPTQTVDIKAKGYHKN
jgi:hypothetical protein